MDMANPCEVVVLISKLNRLMSAVPGLTHLRRDVLPVVSGRSVDCKDLYVVAGT